MKRLAKEENQGTMALDSGICEMENCSRQHMVCAYVCVCVCVYGQVPTSRDHVTGQSFKGGF